MIRLSYKKIDDMLVSNLVPMPDGMVYALIKTNLSFEIRGLENSGGVYIISQGIGKDKKDCKLKIRKSLEELGVVFKDEIRNRG